MKYRKLSLRCEYSRKPESKKDKNIVPEAQRNRLSKRTACQWKVNISWPPSRPTPYISYFISRHSGHDQYSTLERSFLATLPQNKCLMWRRWLSSDGLHDHTSCKYVTYRTAN